jgi:hypothetical protein
MTSGKSSKSGKSGKSGKSSKSGKTETLQAYAGVITTWAIIATVLYIMCIYGYGVSDVINYLKNMLGM